ncbi:MAG: hypothetical protein LBT00_09740, partial [Spirochaetaceae bacterium]|nr:hypothetical protein [Spirochaetaceae bacterium]
MNRLSGQKKSRTGANPVPRVLGNSWCYAPFWIASPFGFAMTGTPRFRNDGLARCPRHCERSAAIQGVMPWIASPCSLRNDGPPRFRNDGWRERECAYSRISPSRLNPG